jgi:hypothetical protein
VALGILIDSTRLLSITANLGDTKTTITHPATTTHGRLTPEERAAVGIGEGLVRVAVGLEDIADIQADLARASLRRFGVYGDQRPVPQLASHQSAAISKPLIVLRARDFRLPDPLQPIDRSSARSSDSLPLPVQRAGVERAMNEVRFTDRDCPVGGLPLAVIDTLL